MSFSPKTSGKIFRPVSKVRFASANKKYNTIILEAKNVLSIVTQKSLGTPAGTFEIAFNYDISQEAHPQISDRENLVNKDKWDEVLAPNDYVEISMGRIGQSPLEIVMRGWIDNVTITEQAGNGTTGPTLRIIVQGRDYGKVWLVTRILNISPMVPPEEAVLQYHVEFAHTNLPKLFDQVLDQIMKPYVDFHKRVNKNIPDFLRIKNTIEPDADSLVLITVSMEYLMEVAYSILAYYQGKPWIELFVQDYDAGPTFVIRWAPLRTPDNKQFTGLLDEYPEQIPNHTISPIRDIIEANLTRSDNDTFNWLRAFQVGVTDVQNQDFGTLVIPKKVPYVIGHSIDMYGLKRYMPQFYFLDEKQGKHKSELDAAQQQVQDIIVLFTLWTAMMYGHNYALNNGGFRVKGLPEYRIGEELFVVDTDEKPVERFYIEGVRQEFVPFTSYQTSLSVTRGMPYEGFGMSFEQMTPFEIPTSFPEDVGQEFLNNTISTLTGGTPTPAPNNRS